MKSMLIFWRPQMATLRLWQPMVSLLILTVFASWPAIAVASNETFDTTTAASMPAHALLTRLMLKQSINGQQNNACRAFDSNSFAASSDPYLQEDLVDSSGDHGPASTPWIGCSREQMPSIYKALSGLPNETNLTQLWIWDSFVPLIPATFFSKVRPSKLIIDRCHTGRIGAADVFVPLGERLIVLELKNNILGDINAEILAPLRRLVRLDLSGNQLTQVSNSVFGKSLPALRSLSLYRNQLTQITDGALDNLVELRSLNLANNRLTRITAATFRNLRMLEYLNLENNRIMEIEDNAFATLTQLRVLNLGGNRLRTVNFPTALPHLRQLLLHNNSFESLDDIKSVANPMPSLETLHLEQNQVKTLGSVDKDNGGLRRWPSLEVLSLASNELASIGFYDFVGLQKLRTLALQGNRLAQLGDESTPSPFSSLVSLNELFLSQNQLLELGDSVFDGLPKLEVLTVGRNKLEKIGKMTLSGFQRLEKLFLNDNRLKSLDSATLEAVQSTLSVIDLSGNPWQCDCELLWLAKWVAERKATMVIDSYETQCGTRSDLFVLKPLADVGTTLAAFCGKAGGMQGVKGSYWDQELISSSNNVWITVLGIVLGVVSIIILLAVSYLYFQETTRGVWRVADGGGVTSSVFGRWTASGVMLRGEHALKRVPSDMVNLIPKSSTNSSTAALATSDRMK